jgi:hypothetical protein
MLGSLVLDTEQFEPLFQHARARIAAITQRTWTNHNESDPGITLLQLLSYLLEQRSFWVDRVSDDFQLVLLQLLGQTPIGARAARVAVELDGRSGPAIFDGGDSFTTRDGRQFRMEHGLGVLPLDPTSVSLTTTLSGSRDRMIELRARRPVLVLPNDGSPARLELSFPAGVPFSTAEPLGLLLALDGQCPPQWSPEAPVTVAAPVALTVRVSTGAGTISEPLTVDDGTCGLRRSGVLRVWPTGWAPDGGLYRLRLEVAACTFAEPVVLTQVTWNAALCGHRAWVRKRSSLASSKLPGRTFDLTPLCPNGPPMGRVHLKLKESAGWRRWSQVSSLTFSGEGERHFVLDGARLRFGDGRRGRQPVLDPNEPNLSVGFWSGGARAGNLPAGVEVARTASGAFSAAVGRTAVEAIGGREPETLALAAERAAASQRAVTRAVTIPDIEALAVASRGVGVGRAIVAPGLREHVPVKVPGAATVFVLPRVARGDPAVPAQLTPFPTPDEGMLEAVRGALARGRLLGSELFVAPPLYRPVCITLKVRSSRTDSAALVQQLRAAVETHLDPVPLPPRSGWPLGQAIDPSDVLAAAQGAIGTTGTIEAVGVSIAGGALDWCRPVEIGPCDLPRLVGFEVQRVSATDEGGLA